MEVCSTCGQSEAYTDLQSGAFEVLVKPGVKSPGKVLVVRLGMNLSPVSCVHGFEEALEDPYFFD